MSIGQNIRLVLLAALISLGFVATSDAQEAGVPDKCGGAILMTLEDHLGH